MNKPKVLNQLAKPASDRQVISPIPRLALFLCLGSLVAFAITSNLALPMLSYLIVIMVSGFRSLLAAVAVAAVSLTVPVAYASSSTSNRVATPFVLALLFIYLIHWARGYRKNSFVQHERIGAILLAYCLVISVTGSALSPLTGIAWSLLIYAAFTFLPVALEKSLHVEKLVTFIGCTAMLWSIFAVVESITHVNPVSPYFESSFLNLAQKWGAYRSETTIGHPLLNATFFAFAGSGVFALFLKSGRKPLLLITGICTFGVFATLSRGGLIGLAGAAIFALLASLIKQASRSRALVLTVGFGTGLLLTLSQVDLLALGGRAASEAEGSTALRVSYVQLLEPLFRVSNGLGTGPGSSDVALHLVGGTLADFPLESSPLQIWASIGVFGFLLLAAQILLVVWHGIRNGAIVGPTMLVSYLTCAAGFNLFESTPSSIILPLVAISITFRESDPGLLAESSREQLP